MINPHVTETRAKFVFFLLHHQRWHSQYDGPKRWWHPTPVLLPGESHGQRSLVGCSPGVAKSWTRLSDFTFTFHFYALEKEMATHSSVLAWRIPGTGEPGGLPSMGSHRVGHDWSDLAAANTFKEPISVSILFKSRNQEELSVNSGLLHGINNCLGWGSEALESSTA